VALFWRVEQSSTLSYTFYAIMAIMAEKKKTGRPTKLTWD